MLINFFEIVGLIIVTLYLGYIFSGFIKIRYHRGFSWQDMKFAIIIVAPAVIFHELAHKFVAISLGLNATFFAFYQSGFTLILALFSIGLRYINAPFIFIIPGFVSVPTTNPINMSIIAFAGPFVNLLLVIIATLVLKMQNLNQKYILALLLTKRINLFLFLFNMLPIPPFDGYKVYSGLISAFS